MKHNLILLCTFSILAGGDEQTSGGRYDYLTEGVLLDHDSVSSKNVQMPIPSAPPASLASSNTQYITELAKELEITLNPDRKREILIQMIKIADMNAYDTNLIHEDILIEEELDKEKNCRSNIQDEEEEAFNLLLSNTFYSELRIQMKEELNLRNIALVNEEENLKFNQITKEEEFYFKQLNHLYLMYNMLYEHCKEMYLSIFGTTNYIDQKYDNVDLVSSIFPQRTVFKNGFIGNIENKIRLKIQNEKNDELNKLNSQIKKYYNSINVQIINQIVQNQSNLIKKLTNENTNLKNKLHEQEQNSTKENEKLQKTIEQINKAQSKKANKLQKHLQAKNKKLQSKIEELREENEELSTRLNIHQTICFRDNKNLEEKMHKMLKEQYETFNKKIDKFQSENSDLSEKLTDLSSKLNKQIREIYDIKIWGYNDEGKVDLNIPTTIELPYRYDLEQRDWYFCVMQYRHIEIAMPLPFYAFKPRHTVIKINSCGILRSSDDSVDSHYNIDLNDFNSYELDYKMLLSLENSIESLDMIIMYTQEKSNLKHVHDAALEYKGKTQKQIAELKQLIKK